MKKTLVGIIITAVLTFAVVAVALNFNDIVANINKQDTEQGDNAILQNNIVTITTGTATINEDDYIDVKTLFAIVMDGENVEITDDMIDCGEFDSYSHSIGNYTVSISFVSPDGKTHIAYSNIIVKGKEFVRVRILHTDLTIVEGESFNPVNMFQLYIEDEEVAVTNEMVSFDDFDILSAAVGNYTVSFSYVSSDGVVHSDTANIIVLRRISVKIESKDVTLYENDADYDFTSLFTLTIDEKSVDITSNMLDFNGLDPDNPIAGDYVIVLSVTTSDGLVHTETANVKVIRGWIGPF